MDLSSIQKDLKATLYERLNSPFIGCFIISWILINYKEVLFFFFSNENINIRISMLESVHSDYNTFILKPLLLSLAFIITHPIVSVVIFWWQERLRDIKRKIKLSIENSAMIPMEEYRKLESQTSEKLTKNNEMTLGYENKIERLTLRNKDTTLKLKEYRQDNIQLRKKISELDFINTDNIKLKGDISQYRSMVDNLKNELKKLSGENDANEETASMLTKQFEFINNYLEKKGFILNHKKIMIDISHLAEHSIRRLTHEIKKIGLIPTLDGDSKSITLIAPFYIETDHIEKLAEKYCSELSIYPSIDD